MVKYALCSMLVLIFTMPRMIMSVIHFQVFKIFNYYVLIENI